MTYEELQQWLTAHGQSITVDGLPGMETRTAICDAFTNPCAPAVTEADLLVLASRLGCSLKQIKAVSQVESGGAGFDHEGRPKILFERHIFHRLTNGKFGLSAWNNPKGGGYSENSWDKLSRACRDDVDAAFASASWGKFQVMGMHWRTLGYPSPLEMAFTAVNSEYAHYEMLARYLEKNNMLQALRKLSTDPETNRAFAKGYNGSGYEQFDYHNKLARAMR